MTCAPSCATRYRSRPTRTLPRETSDINNTLPEGSLRAATHLLPRPRPRPPALHPHPLQHTGNVSLYEPLPPFHSCSPCTHRCLRRPRLPHLAKGMSKSALYTQQPRHLKTINYRDAHRFHRRFLPFRSHFLLLSGPKCTGQAPAKRAGS